MGEERAPGSLRGVETRVSALLGFEHTLLVDSGTVAIALALRAIGAEGRRVVVAANCCPSMAMTIAATHNQPRFVDIDATDCLDPASLDAVDDPQVAAVLFAHMYGNTGDIQAVAAVCKRKGWVLIEDVAQALGARIDDHPAGSFGDLAITSFGRGKIVPAGLGGTLSCHRRDWYTRAAGLNAELPSEPLAAVDSVMKHAPSHAQFFADTLPQLYRGVPLIELRFPPMDEELRAWWQAYRFRRTLAAGAEALEAIERGLEGLPIHLERRRDVAETLGASFRGLQFRRHRDGAVYWVATARVDVSMRDALVTALREGGFRVGMGFGNVAPLFGDASAFPHTEEVARTLVTFPLTNNLAELSRAIEQFVAPRRPANQEVSMAHDPRGDSRRLAPRIEIGGQFVSARIEGVETPLRDISANGAFFYGPPMIAGSIITVKLQLGRDVSTLSGRVIRTDRRGSAVAWESLSEEARRGLDQLVTDLLAYGFAADDRRRDQRVELSEVVQFSRIPDPSSTEPVDAAARNGVLRDASASGAFVLTDHSPPKGARVIVHVLRVETEPQAGGIVGCQAVVLHSLKDGFACRFEEPSTEFTLTLLRLLEREGGLKVGG